MACTLVPRMVAVALVVAAAAPLAAQQTAEQLRAKFTISVPQQQIEMSSQPFFRGAPGTSSGSPMGFGPNWRDAFVGGGYQQVRGIRRPDGSVTGGGNSDGSVSGGFGLGNSHDAIGLEVIVTSLSTFRSGFGNVTAFSFKAHHMVSGSAAIAVGVENAFVVGGYKTDGTSSVYVVASKVIGLSSSNGYFKALTVSGGIGNGRFRFQKDVTKDQKTVNAFGSAGLLIVDQLSAIADWTGQDLTLGASIVPFKKFPFILTPALADVTGTASDKMRFIMGAGIGIRF